MTRHSLRPSLESLEAREVPATFAGPKFTLVEAEQIAAVPAGGTVTATFAGGRLTITGDAADNTLLIGQMDDGRLVLSANGSGTVIRLNGGPADGTVTLPAPVTGGVTVNLGDGADQLIVDTVTLPGSLAINGGNGEAGGPAGNTVYLRDVHVGGNLGITNLAGADSTFIWGTTTVNGALTIRNGDGGSNIWGDRTTDLRVGGTFSIVDGAGFDKVDLWAGVNVALGGLVVNTGTDTDGSYLRIHPFGNFTVNGSIRVTNGPGADFTDFGGQNLVVRGAVAIHNGDGGSSNTLLARDTLYAGQVSITNGAGNDSNQLFCYDKEAFGGNVTFVNGPGDSDNYIGGNNALGIIGSVRILNGTGRDLNTIGSGDCRIGGSVVIRDGDGGSDNSISGDFNLLVQGATRITAGAGFDQVHLGDNRVAPTNPAVDLGPVSMNLGNGGSDTEVSGGRLNVHGSLNITAGDGSDAVLVTTKLANGKVAGNLFVDLGRGDNQVVAINAATGQVLTIGGALGVSTDDPVGQSWTDLRGLDVHGWTEFWTGDGSDGVLVTGSTFRGAFDMSTEGGNDVVYLEWAGGSTNFRGPAWFDTGDGSDHVWVLGGPGGGWLEFNGKTTFDGSGGTGDVMTVADAGDLFFHSQPTVTGFETAP
jgi:hypothetical protein